ncbi:MAG: hypothetical protein IPN86_10675 [Saprospiraceae bacterium]|nr:hypothetical protein [Saprospiraceae bacterium]
MKTIFTFCTIIFFTSSNIASGIDLRYYTGLWYNPQVSKKIEIMAYEDGFKIKGLHSKYSHNWFERINKFTFQDYAGNKIRLIDGNIVYFPYRSKRKVTFYKVSNGVKSANKDNYKSRDENHRHKDQEHNNTNKIISFNNKIFDLSNVNLDKLEGSWLAKSVDKIVYITETRDGLKAKFNIDKKWYSYTYNSKTGEYVSLEGHKYQFTTPDLTWNDSTGKKEIMLIKISDDLIY